MTRPTARRSAGTRRALVGACVGNAVEWYDFAIYGAFATVLAQVFFPPGEQAALAATFAIFATSFVARPIGAMLVGRRSDQRGRRPVLSRMIAVMTGATAAIALIPSWSVIGVLAPALLLLLRLTQGFSVGGEVASSVAFLSESAPAGSRGRFGGWHTASIAIGLSAGYAVAALLSAAFPDDVLMDWGWRLAFLSALPLGLVARYIRRRLDETPMFEAVAAPAKPRVIADVVRGRAGAIGRGFLLVTTLSVAFNLWFVFLPGYVAAEATIPLGAALGSGVIGLLTAAVTAPVMGRLSDRLGRRPVLITGTLAIAVFAVPGFALAGRAIAGLLLADVLLAGLLGTLVVTAFVAELFPTEVRATGVAVTYGLSTAIFGGTAPLVATLLAGAESAWAIPGYLTVVALLGLAAAVTARETAFDRFR
ncbi:MFS transporter [Actinoplanes aureus]|uniref:MFS transporter n=1 Tax=Actinoplanes aureus TaxID=2792083 RepID=A0A931G0R4_9ACTN|nr:MFS transporter [Actinoplanes aureus]MBG0567073.1 MFS transporter [Actinoplanes aureus]